MRTSEAENLPVLEVKELIGGYGQADILHGVSVHVDEGELVTIIGPNGAGKSTLIKGIFGMLDIREGRVLFRGRNLTGKNPVDVVREGIGYVPQVDNVFTNLSVQENLEMGAYLREDDPTPQYERVFELFPVLRERRREKAGRLSGGQRQMVAMGRALMLNPKLLLLDEPSAGLAPNLQDAVFENVRGIVDAGVPVLMVEQNAKKALRVSDRGYVLDMGRNKYEGGGQELLEDERVGRLYLGGT